MTARQFGAYSARIIGPQAHIDGPRGLRIIAGAAVLRNMLGASGMPQGKRDAMEWALMKLEGVKA